MNCEELQAGYPRLMAAMTALAHANDFWLASPGPCFDEVVPPRRALTDLERYRSDHHALPADWQPATEVNLADLETEAAGCSDADLELIAVEVVRAC